MTMFTAYHHDSESSRVHTVNAEQRQMAADHWTKPTDLSHRPACRLLEHYIHHIAIYYYSARV